MFTTNGNRLSTSLLPVMDELFRDALAPKRAVARTRFVPHLDLSEKDDRIVLALELPGLGEDDVEITYEDGKLIVSGEKTVTEESEDRRWFRRERRHGSFRRSVLLPDDVDTDRIEAHFEHGLLTVTVPRLVDESKGPRRIPIRRAVESTADASGCDADECVQDDS